MWHSTQTYERWRRTFAVILTWHICSIAFAIVYDLGRQGVPQYAAMDRSGAPVKDVGDDGKEAELHVCGLAAQTVHDRPVLIRPKPLK